MSADVKITFGADISAIRTATHEINESVKRIADRSTDAATRLMTLFNGVLPAIKTAAEAMKKPFAEFSRFEDTSTRLAPLVGGLQEAKALCRELREEAAKGVVPFEDLAGIAARLSTVFKSAENVKKWTSVFHNISAATGADANGLAAAFIKARARANEGGGFEAGLLDAFTTAGVNIWEPLSKQTGRTADELKKMASAGKLAFSEVENAILSLASGTGKFADQAAALSGTLSGQLGTLTSNFNTLLANSVEPLATAITPLVGSLAKITGSVANATGFAAWARNVAFLTAAFSALNLSVKKFTGNGILEHASRAGAAIADLGRKIKYFLTTAKPGQVFSASLAGSISEKALAGNTVALQKAATLTHRLGPAFMTASRRAQFLSAAFKSVNASGLTFRQRMSQSAMMLSVVFPRACAAAAVAAKVVKYALVSMVPFGIGIALQLLIDLIINIAGASDEAADAAHEHAKSLKEIARTYEDIRDRSALRAQKKSHTRELEDLRDEINALEEGSDERLDKEKEYAEKSEAIAKAHQEALTRIEKKEQEAREKQRREELGKALAADEATRLKVRAEIYEADFAKKNLHDQRGELLYLASPGIDARLTTEQLDEKLRNHEAINADEFERLWKIRKRIDELDKSAADAQKTLRDRVALLRAELAGTKALADEKERQHRAELAAEFEKAGSSASDAARNAARMLRLEKEVAEKQTKAALASEEKTNELLRAELDGNTEVIKQLREKAKLEETIANLKSKNIDETSAERLARERVDLENKIEARKRTTPQTPALVGAGTVASSQNAVGGGRSINIGMSGALSIAREQLSTLKQILSATKQQKTIVAGLA